MPRRSTERTVPLGRTERFVLETEDPGFRFVIQLDRENLNREGRIHESVPTIESGHAWQSVSLAG